MLDIITFAIVWWLVLFMLLPIGASRPEAPQAGHAAGAPDRPNIKQKMWWATLIAAVISALFIVVSDIFGWVR